MQTARLLPLSILLAGLLSGCGSAPEPRPAAPAVDQAEAGTRRYSETIDRDYVLDYEVETRYSSIDKTSCYAFLTGTVTNQTGQTLSRRSTVAFKVYHGNELLFRDFTYLRANAMPGGRVQFEMVESPLFRKQCPRFDRIEATLNLVVLKTVP